MNHFMELTAEKLSVLTRRTEPFSPSKHSSQRSQLMCNSTSSNYHHDPPSPRTLFPPALPATESILRLSPPPTSSTQSPSQSASPNSRTLGPLPPSPDSQPPVVVRSAQIVTVASNASGGQVYPPTSGFPRPASILSSTTISASNQRIYHVLLLSPFATPGQPVVHTSHDLVLPPTSFFVLNISRIYDC
jgi:hypothetical protein